MTTKEVTKDLIGRRCECIFTGMMVTGTIIDTRITEHTAEVDVKFDKPHVWGDYTYEHQWSWGRLFDDFGPLGYLKLI